MASKKELFKKKSEEIRQIHNTPKPVASFNDTERIKASIEILPELQAFIRPLTDEQFYQLEQNILTHGCQDALILWETSESDLSRGESERSIYILVDGHNRYKVCKKHGIDFRVIIKTFENIDQVKDFMIDLQIGRRNLTLEEEAYYRGMKYNTQKGIRGNALQKSDSRETINVAEQLANKFNVSVRTIKNDGKFAEGLNKLSNTLKTEVLQGKVKVSRREVQALADKDLANESVSELKVEPNNELQQGLINEAENRIELHKQIKLLSQKLTTKQQCDKLIEKIGHFKQLL